MNESHKKALQSFLSQAPNDIELGDAKRLLEKHNWDVVDAMVEVWNVPSTKKSEISAEQQKWKEIRDISNDFDTEMQNHIRNMTSK